MDTGACRSIIDKEMAEACGLSVVKSSDGNFGTYCAPGCGAIPYYGIVWGPITVQMSAEVSF